MQQTIARSGRCCASAVTCRWSACSDAAHLQDGGVVLHAALCFWVHAPPCHQIRAWLKLHASV
jgi:hypothetical protein